MTATAARRRAHGTARLADCRPASLPARPTAGGALLAALARVRRARSTQPLTHPKETP